MNKRAKTDARVHTLNLAKTKVVPKVCCSNEVYVCFENALIAFDRKN